MCVHPQQIIMSIITARSEEKGFAILFPIQSYYILMESNLYSI